MALPLEAYQPRYTFADVLSWNEDTRIELINGYPVMLATPTDRHQVVNGELFRQLANYLLGKKCRVYHPPYSVWLFAKAGDRPENIDTCVEPDITIVCDPKKRERRGCKGAPDLIAEILSPSTALRDRTMKRELYEKAGVREYWIVDPEKHTVSVYTMEDGRYGAEKIYLESASVPVGVLKDCNVDLSLVFAEEDVEYDG